MREAPKGRERKREHQRRGTPLVEAPEEVAGDLIRNRDTAKLVLELLDGSHFQLMESLRLVRANCPDQEYNTYRASIASILADVFFPANGSDLLLPSRLGAGRCSTGVY